MISTNRKGFKVHKKQMMMMLNSLPLLFWKQVWRTIITEKWQYKTSLNFSKRPLSNSTSDHVMYVANGHCCNGEIERLFFAGISPSFNCSLCYYYSSDAHFDTQYPVEPSCDARRIRAYGSDRFALRVCRVAVVTWTRLYAAVRSTLSLKATKSPPCRPRQKKNFFHVKCMETRP